MSRLIDVWVYVQMYYGNPLSCTWSQDEQYIAAGGEDDLVAVFGMEEQRVVAWGEGHGSWVSAVSFDPWCHPTHIHLNFAVMPSLFPDPIP